MRLALPRRRWIRGLLAALALIVLLRLLLPLVLPGLLGGVLGELGFQVRWERLALSPLLLEVELSHLEIEPVDGPGPRLHAERFHADLAFWPLLSGTLHLRRVELDGLAVALERDARGQLVLPAALRAAPESDAPAEALADPAPEVAAAGPVALLPALRLDAARVQQVRVAFRDAAVDPPVDTRLDLELALSNLGVPGRATRLSLHLAAAGILDRLLVEVEGPMDREQVEASLTLSARGLHLPALSGYLAPLGLTATARALSLAADATASIRGGHEPRLDLTIGQVELAADGVPAVTLGPIALAAAKARDGALVVERAEVAGLRLAVERLAGGALAVPGLSFVPRPAAVSESAPASSVPAPPLRVTSLRLADHRLALVDRTADPPVALDLLLEEFVVSHLDSRPAPGDEPARLTGHLVAPGLFDGLDLGGQFAVGAPFALDLALDGLAPRALDALLAEQGLAVPLHDGELSLRLGGQVDLQPDGGLRADLALSDLRLAEGAGGAGVLLELDEVALTGIARSAVGERVAVDALTIRGLRAEARLDDEGTLHLPGLELRGPGAPGAAAAGARSSSASGTVPGVAPHVTLGRVVFSDSQLAFHAPGRPSLRAEELHLRLDGVDLPPGALPSFTALDLDAGLPGLVETLMLDAAARRDGQAVDLDLECVLAGLSGAGLPAPPPGAPSVTLRQGELSLLVAARVTRTGAGLSADVELPSLMLSEGEQELFVLDGFSASPVSVGPAGLALGTVALEGLSLPLVIDERGGLRFAGLRLPPASERAPSPESPDRGATTERPARTERDVAAASTVEPPRAAPALRLERLDLQGLTLALRDESKQPVAEESVSAALVVTGLLLSDAPPTAALDLQIQPGDGPAELRLQGEFVPSPASPSARLTLVGTALDLRPFAPWLPPGVEPSLSAGDLGLDLSLDVAPHAAGGQSLELRLADLRLAEAGQDEPLFAWDELALRASRLDPAAREFHVAELSLTGVVGELGRDAAGGLCLPGVTLRVPGPATATPSATAASAAPEVPPEAAVAAAAPPAAPAPPGVTAAAGAAHPGGPRVTLERLAVDVGRLRWREPSRADVALTDLSLTLAEPLRLTAEFDELPVNLTLAASLPPLLDRLRLDAALAPFAVEPTARLELAVDGLRGPALAGVAPDLAATLDAAGLADGRAGARLSATWMGRRRGPLDFAPGPGVPLDIQLTDVFLRDGPDGETLLGLSSLQLDVASALGAAGNLHLRTVELVDPVARLTARAEGLEVGGLLLRPAPPTGAVGSADAGLANAVDPRGPANGGTAASAPGDADLAASDLTERASEAAGAPSPADPAGSAPAPAPDLRLDRLLVSGADLLFVDVTTDPPLVLPLGGLDLEVRDLGTRALRERVPVAIDLALRSAAAPAPWERGPVFDELAVEALLALHPRPTGRARLTLDGFDLPAVAGPAAAASVTLTAGRLDARVDLHFQDDGDLDADARFLFTDLDVSEPADGPIASFLQLPAPLAPVLFVLRDEDGVIDVPLSFGVGAGGLSLGEIARVAVTTLGVLIGQAIANTPFRVVGGLTDTVEGLVGFDFLSGQDEPAGDEQRLPCARGGASLTGDGDVALAALAQRLADEDDLHLTLRHEPGRADLTLMAQRANPSAGHVTDLAQRLRLRRSLALDERDGLARRLRSQIQAGLDDGAATSSRQLAALEYELGLLELALDELLEILRPGAQAMADRRTRAMLVALGQLRLAEAAATLRASLPADAGDRLRVVSPRPGDEPSSDDGALLVTPKRVRD